MTLPTLHPLCLSTTFELLNALSSSVLSLLCFLLHGRVLSTPRANPTFSKYKSNHPFSYTDHFFSNGFILLALKHIKSLLLKIKQINFYMSPMNQRLWDLLPIYHHPFAVGNFTLFFFFLELLYPFYFSHIISDLLIILLCLCMTIDSW